MLREPSGVFEISWSDEYGYRVSVPRLLEESERIKVIPLSEHDAAMTERQNHSVERLAIYLLNQYRATAYMAPVDSLDSLSEFGQEDWRNKARAALAAAFGQEDTDG